MQGVAQTHTNMQGIAQTHTNMEGVAQTHTNRPGVAQTHMNMQGVSQTHMNMQGLTQTYDPHRRDGWADAWCSLARQSSLIKPTRACLKNQPLQLFTKKLIHQPPVDISKHRQSWLKSVVRKPKKGTNVL